MIGLSLSTPSLLVAQTTGPVIPTGYEQKWVRLEREIHGGQGKTQLLMSPVLCSSWSKPTLAWPGAPAWAFLMSSPTTGPGRSCWTSNASAMLPHLSFTVPLQSLEHSLPQNIPWPSHSLLLGPYLDVSLSVGFANYSLSTFVSTTNHSVHLSCFTFLHSSLPHMTNSIYWCACLLPVSSFKNISSVYRLSPMPKTMTIIY